MNIDVVMYSIVGVLGYIACAIFMIIGLSYVSKHRIPLFGETKEESFTSNDIILLGFFWPVPLICLLIFWSIALFIVVPIDFIITKLEKLVTESNN